MIIIKVLVLKVELKKEIFVSVTLFVISYICIHNLCIKNEISVTLLSMGKTIYDEF